jgi:hypothetical protein
MFKHRRRGLGAALLLLLAVPLIAGVGGATRAFASEPAVVHGETTVTTNADGTFTAKVTIKNSGAYPGGVNVGVRRCANVQGLSWSSDSLVLDPGESAVVTITGKLTDPTKPGCFEVDLGWVSDKPGWFDDGYRTSSTHINVNPAPAPKPTPGGQPGGQQGGTQQPPQTPEGHK